MAVEKQLAPELRQHHGRQRLLGRLAAPLWTPLAGVVLRLFFGFEIAEMKEVRRAFRRVRADRSTPLLLCANHLTLIDSFVIAWALAPAWRYAVDFDTLPWNTPERTNFASTRVSRVLAYLAKCIPITRGGRRQDVAAVLDRIVYLLARRELALIFPEGGRSRSGRVDPDSAAWGVGRIVGALPSCRVLCVYMRGEGQQSWSEYPERGERFRVQLEVVEPKSDQRGARRSRDLAQQIVTKLAQMEANHLAAHPALAASSAQPASKEGPLDDRQ